MEQLLSNNPYFSAGFGLIGVTASLALLRKASMEGIILAKRRLLVSLEIPSKDHSYQWLLNWLASQQRQNQQTPGSKSRRSLFDSLLSQKHHELAVETSFQRHENGSTSTQFSLVPGLGRHFLKYKGAWIHIERQRERTMIDLKTGAPWETVKLTTLSRDRALFSEMLEEARSMAAAKEVGKTVIYTSYGPDWRPFGQPRRRRPLSSVVLDKTLSEEIFRDVELFLRSSKWYHDRGIPYRRGYLLYGPPGTGKTSYIQALAGQLEYNICLLNLSERGLTDDRLAHLLNNVPPRSILLLEDIDAAFTNRTASELSQNQYQSMLTFSGLLNALDGVAASEERLIFMTTNHAEKLDPALIRPGRIDYKSYIGNASKDQIQRMFLRFYQIESDLNPTQSGMKQLEIEKAADTFLNTLEASGKIGKVSPAALQGHFVVFREGPQKAIDHIDDLITTTHHIH